jgi:hypothetical protein
VKNMRPQSNSIKQLAPVIASLGRDLATNFRSAGLEIAKERGNRFGNRNTEGHVGASFGSGEGDCAAYQIHSVQRDSSFTQAASCGQSDLKTYPHPLGHDGMTQGISDGLNLSGREGGKGSDLGGILNSVVVEGVRLQSAQQSSLPLYPLHHLNVSAGLIAMNAVAGSVAVSVSGPSVGTTPDNESLSLSGAEVLQVQGVLGHEKLKPVPTVNVVASGQRACGPVVDVYQYPVVTAKSSLLLCYGYLGRLGQALCAMQLRVESVLSRLTLPNSILFVPNRVAIGTASFINRSHVTNVAPAIFP